MLGIKILKSVPRRSRLLVVALVLCLATGFFLLQACSPSYVVHLALGQLRSMGRSIPADEALRGPLLTMEEKDALRLVARVKLFGEDELGLTRTGSYQSVDAEISRAPIYTISAASKTKLELVTWWFPVVGRMPYLGFFDMQRALARKQELEREGLDVMIWAAGAYSTLGWFKDPVPRSLLKREDLQLVDTILHEMTHATIWVKGRPTFNETLANLVGRHGAVAFMEAASGRDSLEARAARAALRDQRRFSDFIGRLAARLEELYQSPITREEKLIRREVVFSEAAAAFSSIEPSMETDRYLGFGARGLNNALILGLAVYHRHFNLLDSVVESCSGDLRQALSVFRYLSLTEGDPIRKMEAWFS
ncbi:MAG: aminopeptidase [Desulfobacteraceae bacterium]